MENGNSQQPETFPLGFHGRAGEMFRIHIVNILLAILTIGFFRFWGKTRMRRYLWNHVSLGDERLEYTGTGKELFIGFLIVVLAVLLPVFGGLGGWRAYLSMVQSEWVFLPDIIQYAAIAYLVPVGIYRARRYRLTRTQWRGIRGGQSGSAWAYGARSVGYYVLTALTLGLAWPLASARLTAFKMENTWFGDRRFRFAAPAKPLYRTYLVVWALYLLPLILLGVGAGLYLVPLETGIETIGSNPLPVPLAADDTGMGEFSVWHWMVVIVLLLLFTPLLYVLAALPWFWYRAREIRYFAGCAGFEDLGFVADVNGGKLARLVIGNAVITVVTLGLGVPIVYRRQGAFVAARMRIVGEMDLSAILQSAAARPTTGEGLADAFDVGDF